MPNTTQTNKQADTHPDKQKLIFSLDQFEGYIHRNQYELAARELLALLNFLDTHYGVWGTIGTHPSNDRTHDQLDRHIITRTVAAISTLFADPEFKINVQGWGSFVFYHRWLTTLYGASDFVNADHVLHLLKSPYSESGKMTFDDVALIKFSLLYSGDSNIPLQAEEIWNKNPAFAAGLCMALLSSRLTITPQAMEKKEQLLKWLPKKLETIELHDALLPYLHDVWMHCSYAFTPEKHQIKRALNTLIRKRLLDHGCQEPAIPNKREIKQKPTIVIPLEWFTSGHAMYRCYAPAIKALRMKFTTIAIARPHILDHTSREGFDQIIEIAEASILDQVRNIVEQINAVQPDIIYYPSIGMQLAIVALATLRLAPMQIASQGHPASSFSKTIDYAIAEADYWGKTSCYSEQVVKMPNHSTPFVPPHNSKKIPPQINRNPEVVKIAITASIMKLNPVFLTLCQQIAKQATIPTEFHFFVGHGSGITRHYITNAIERYLKNSIIYPHTPYEDYINNLNICDLFICPLPFGNSNGVVDTVRQGLPGVCLYGDELHSSCDRAYFQRLGLPDWCVAKNHDDYIRAATTLINDHQTRVNISQQIIKNDPDQILFQGDTMKFLASIMYLYKNHDKNIKSNRKTIKL